MSNLLVLGPGWYGHEVGVGGMEAVGRSVVVVEVGEEGGGRLLMERRNWDRSDVFTGRE